MRVVIHRGTNEIGSTCVEVRHEDTRILLDAGTPLDDSEASLPEDIDRFSAVLISHPHKDHYGLIEHLPDDVPLHMGPVGWRFTQSVRVFMGLPVQDEARIIPVKAGKQFTVGTITILPYLVDHSTPEAFGFLLEASGKRLYYSGDFRAHGRKGKTFDYLCERLPKDLDAMLLEGTMLQRSNMRYGSEAEVEQGMVDAINAETGLVCVNCSGQNVDRIVSAYRAARRTGRQLVVDIYTALVLRLSQELSTRIPDVGWDDVRVLYKGSMARGQFVKAIRQEDFFDGLLGELYRSGATLNGEDVLAEPGRYVVRLSDYLMGQLVDGTGEDSSTYIYSQWGGYLEDDGGTYYRNADRMREREGTAFHHIHTSGHAVLDDLKRLVEAVRPRVVLPLHTEHKTKYEEHFPGVHVLDDGEVYEV